MRNDHDTGYKLLFAHPELVRELLLDYMPGEWIEDADFATLERINASYVSESLKQRHDDVVWRVRLKDRWVWIYLVLEFQSEPDPWMALRLMIYVGLLAQDLIRRGELIECQLPPILPLVLYNGLPEWNAAKNVDELFSPSPRGLEQFRPRMSYHLFDEARLKLHPAESVKTAVDALFRLEHARSPEELRHLIRSLAEMLQDPSLIEVRRSFTLWIKSLLRRKVSHAKEEEINSITDLMEADTMLAERIESWFAERELLGKQQGLQMGIEQGIEQGVLQGESALLRRQLSRRFGFLPDTVDTKLSQASLDQLESWGDRILDANSLDDVFLEH